MSEIAKMILSFMLVLALICVVFGIGSKVDFFGTVEAILTPLNELATYGSKMIQNVYNEPIFLPNEDIMVVRLYFDDGHYCDVARYNTYFAKEKFVYSSNPDVVSYSNSVLIDCRVFCDSNGNVIYKQGLFQTVYTLTTTYELYLYNYQESYSLDGWSEGGGGRGGR